jgi:hypothetical protein
LQPVPLPHAVPSLALDHAVVDVAGVQTSHAFIGFAAPAASIDPPMKHCAPHVPAWQTMPAPHAVPSLRFACAQAPAPSQASAWHGLPSLGHATPTPAFVTVHPPLPSHADATWQTPGVHVYEAPPQAPAVQTSLEVHALPSLHAVPLVALDHAVVEIAGSHA